jgi:crotonobetaine/carnitine-CoA ligase
MASDLEISDLMKPVEVLSLYPKHDYTMQSLYDTRIDRDPKRLFIVFRDKTWSWAGFRERILRTAKMLAAKGIRKGDRVGVMATNSDGHVLLMFALARIRAILVPVNPEFGVDEARYVLNHAAVSAVACS